MSSPVVSFVIATHDGHDVLGRCLDSIARQTLRDFEVVVFDNASKHGITAAMRDRDPRFAVQRCERNLGFAAANNRAIAGTRGAFIALVNDDAWLAPHWAETMVSALEAHPKAGAAAGRTMQAAHPDRVDAAGFDFYSCAAIYCWRNVPAARLTNATHQPFGPVASVAMYRRSALDRVGAFHPEYFCYYEDTDLAVRLVLHDQATVYVPEALAYHVGSHTGRERSAFQIYHLRRNIEYLYWVNMLGSLAWRNLPFHLAFEALACGRAALAGHPGAALLAKRDAMLNAPWIMQQRRALRRNLDARQELAAAKRRLRARMRTGLPFVRAREARAKSMSLPHKAPLLGVGISVTTYAEVVSCILEAAQAKRSLLVSACAVHALMEAIDDPVLAAVLNRFEIVAPDGQPIRWGLNWAHHANLRERVYGPTLMLKVCDAAAPANLSVYLYGSREHTLQRLAAKLSERTPGLRIAGQRAGRFRALSESEQADDARAILDSGASIVFVGMGAPRQDWWIFHMRDRIPLPMLALGAAFDFNAGLIAQAPPILQDNGLEWLFRLTREPKRLWRRYLTLTPRYLPLIATQVLGLRTFTPQEALHEADQRPCPG